MKVRIHRGAKEIGGTCIEIESQGSRVALDAGQPLDSPDAEFVDLPDVEGFRTADPSLLGVVISHPHLDHYGLAFRILPTTTFLMGEAAQRIMAAAAVFTPSGGTFSNVIHLADQQPIDLGPFRITPFLMDHSAYDSYALLIESHGNRLFYTGDLRGHGRKAGRFERLVASPPKDVHVLLMEGTTITRSGTDEGFPTEADIEEQLVEIFCGTKGLPLVWCSGQNIDRIVTIFKAAKRSNRQFIIDMYTAHILKATGNPRIPQDDWEGVRVFLPKFQRRRIKHEKAFDVSKLYSRYRIYPEALAAAADRSVMLFRPSMCGDVDEAACLTGACLVYSMWDGYLANEKMKAFRTWVDERNIPMFTCHTSRHASVRDLLQLRNAFSSAVVVPIHTQQPEVYKNLFSNVKIHQDGEWWQVRNDERENETKK